MRSASIFTYQFHERNKHKMLYLFLGTYLSVKIAIKNVLKQAKFESREYSLNLYTL